MKPRIFGIGETVLDLIIKNNEPKALKAGGSILNAMVSLARCKHEVYFISEIGNDKSGDMILSFLAKNHIKTDYIKRFSNGQTPLAMAFLNDNNDAGYEFYKNYPDNRILLSPNDFLPSDIILFGSFFSINPIIRNQVYNIVTRAKKAGSTIIYDPNFRKTNQQNEDIISAVKKNMQLANIIKASNEDVENLFNINSSDQIKTILLPLCKKVIITSAAKGVDFFTNNHIYHFHVPTIKPLSTIGAGDNFNAGITHAIASLNNDIANIKLHHWEKIIQSGIDFATEVCLSFDNYISTDFATLRVCY
ncbi:MAG: fructokinase [Marinilabiliaceae bacterium]|nr:fructokinase [Marinilabiliaceae bacterium]